MTSDQALAVELRGITKRFPGVVANRDVDLAVRAGTVHALVGENGAGKSTLMKVLYGMQRPDEGVVRIDGRDVRFARPADAIAAGVGMVHQHFMLADNLTVLENVILGSEPGRGWRGAGRVDFAAARARIAAISADYGLGVDPDRTVADLGVGARQRVEILKVLYRGARILILDEPTAVLVPQEVEELFANLRGLTAEGLTVLFISHKLDEVLRVADEITVLRRGTTVATVEPATTSARRLAELMVGSELPSPPARTAPPAGDAVLTVERLSLPGPAGRPLLDDVSLSIARGEVLGIAGVEGNGQAELVEALLGMRGTSGGETGGGARSGTGGDTSSGAGSRARTSGRITLAGADLSGVRTRRRREAGLGVIPEDRHRHGLLLEAPLWENRILGHQTQRPNARGRWLDKAGARRDTERLVGQYDVRTPGIDVLASALSGGNQQKLIVGREMAHDPKVLIAAHPTRGVDVGAQAAIWAALRRARDQGLAVLLISADLDELIGLSDRLLVMLRGRLVAELDPATVTPEQLGAAMTGAG